MKTCSACKLLLPLDEFYVRKTGYIFSNCKKCTMDKARKWQADNQKIFASQGKAANTKARQRNRDFLFDYLNSHPCVDCGETDYLVLEFDHVLGKKKMGVATMAHRSFSLETIKKEIDKCVVRCCNCHRRRTIKEVGSDWWLRIDR